MSAEPQFTRKVTLVGDTDVLATINDYIAEFERGGATFVRATICIIDDVLIVEGWLVRPETH